MSINKVLQAVLFSLILVGVFASMAQNNYGFGLMGWACFGLALLYVCQLFWNIAENVFTLEWKNLTAVMELFLLSLLSLIFGFRFFYIPIPAGEIIFVTLSILLLLTYVFMAIELLTLTKKVYPSLARRLIFLYSSLCIFMLSMTTRIFNARVSEFIGALGMLVGMIFIMAIIQSKSYEYFGKTISLFQIVVKSKNKVGLLFLFFITSAIYFGLSNIGIIPKVENAEKPKTYIDLINEAEGGKEKPIQGKYKHEAYKEAMDQFLKRHGGKK